MKRMKIAYIFLIMVYASNIWSTPASLDTSFNGTGFATLPFTNGTATGCTLQTDGKIVVVGYEDTEQAFIVGRFNSDGSLDRTFASPNGYFRDYVTSGQVNIATDVAIDANGRIFVTGLCNTSGPSGANNIFVACYSSTGILDTSFNSGGTSPSANGYIIPTFTDPAHTSYVTNAGATSISILPNGNILVGGWISENAVDYIAGVVLQYLPSGSPNTLFGVSTHYGNNLGYSTFIPTGQANCQSQSMAVQSNGKIVVSGQSNTNYAFIVRLNTNGSLDTSFNGSGSLYQQFGSNQDTGATGINVASNGDIIITGFVVNNNPPIGSTADTDMFVARYKPSGSLDTTFNPNGSTPGVAYFYIGQLSHGYGVNISLTNKITIVGSATINSVPKTEFIARYNANGSLDTSLTPTGYIISSIIYNFIPFNRYNSYVGYEIPVQQDGKLLIVGESTTTDLPIVERYLGGSLSFAPTLSIETYGQNSNFIEEFLPVDFYAEVITDPIVRSTTLLTINEIISSYALDYANQPNFNFINYLYLLNGELVNAQADLIFTYPEATAEINLFFAYINDEIAILNNL